MLAVVEDEVEAVHVVEQGEEAEPEEDPADRVPRLRPRDHVADTGVRAQDREGDAVVRRPGVVRHEGQGYAGDEEERRCCADGLADPFVPQDHGANLRPGRYGIVTRRNDPGTKQE